MNAALLFLLGFIFAVSTHAASRLNFSNTATTLLTTQSCFPPLFNGVTTGAGQYTIGLYIAPFGATNDDPFVLVATTPSLTGISNGLFNGGILTLQFPPGTPLSLQIRAWSTAAGATYEQALQTGPIAPGTYAGKSARGWVVVYSAAPGLMGSDYGQVPGFALYSLCNCPCGPPRLPENVPLSVVPLSVPGLGGGHFISWPNDATSYVLQSSSTVPGSWNAIYGFVANDGTRLTYYSTNAPALRFYRLRRY